MTSELRKLLDQQPVVPFATVEQAIEADLGHPVDAMVLWIDPQPLGSASIVQTRALLDYYYRLVTGDSKHAARYLAAVALQGSGADVAGFTREVEDLSRRWSRTPTFKGFSLGRLLLESVSQAGRFRMYFPVEMVLMVKAPVTFEGVGQMRNPDLDVAAISRKHITRIFMERIAPLRMVQESGARRTARAGHVRPAFDHPPDYTPAMASVSTDGA